MSRTQKQYLAVKMLERLHSKVSSLSAEIPYSASFAGAACIKNVVAWSKLKKDIVKDPAGIELNSNSLEIVEKFCYLGDMIRASGGCSWQCYSKDQEWVE